MDAFEQKVLHSHVLYSGAVMPWKTAVSMISATVAVLAVAVAVLLAVTPLGDFKDSLPVPLEGVFAPNKALQSCELLFAEVSGPETIALHPDPQVDTLYAFSASGEVLALDPESSESLVLANTGGRPISGVVDEEGNVFFLDALVGLLKYDAKTQKVEYLASFSHGRRMNFVDDIAMFRNGTLVFSDATMFRPESVSEMLSVSGKAVISMLPSGRVLSFDPKTKSIKTMLGGFIFANGVAISKDESFVLVADSGAFRLFKVSSGFRKETFGPPLPGIPDGIRLGTQGDVWVAIVKQVPQILQAMLPYRLLRALLFHVPIKYLPLRHYDLIIHLDAFGNPIESFHDPSGRLHGITSVIERNGYLYLGTLSGKGILRCDLKKLRSRSIEN
jgi:sugar lactone lactonase YvrE